MANDSRVGRALREAGLKPCPRWWLTDEQLDLVAYMARQNAELVDEVRARVREEEIAWRRHRGD